VIGEICRPVRHARVRCWPEATVSAAQRNARFQGRSRFKVDDYIRSLMTRSRHRPSAVLRQALIFGPDDVLAVDSFEPANSEMTSSHLLKMLDKGVVDGSAA
jgi:hypothetical protein